MADGKPVCIRRAHLRVEVAVEEDDRVRGDEVQACGGSRPIAHGCRSLRGDGVQAVKEAVNHSIACVWRSIRFNAFTRLHERRTPMGPTRRQASEIEDAAPLVVYFTVPARALPACARAEQEHLRTAPAKPSHTLERHCTSGARLELTGAQHRQRGPRMLCKKAAFLICAPLSQCKGACNGNNAGHRWGSANTRSSHAPAPLHRHAGLPPASSPVGHHHRRRRRRRRRHRLRRR